MQKIVLVSPGRDCTQWIKALQQQNPDVQLEVYPNDTQRAKTEYLLAWNPPNAVFEEFPNLKVVASMGAGVHHITKNDKLPADVKVTKVESQQLQEDLSVFVLTLALQHIRHLSTYHQQQTAQHWHRHPYATPDKTTVGILGFGSIGQAVGERLVDNKFKVIGWSRSKKEHAQIKTYAQDALADFLSQTDILVCLLPLTKDTKGFLNQQRFHQLKKGAYLINVGRGPHIVENDLREALDNHQLCGAALDVFPEEPLPKSHWFWSHNNIFITPHTASITHPKAVAPQIMENFIRFSEGMELKHQISRDKGY